MEMNDDDRWRRRVRLHGQHVLVGRRRGRADAPLRRRKRRRVDAGNVRLRRPTRRPGPPSFRGGILFFCFLICFFGFRLVWPSVSISGGHAGGRGRCASQDPKLVPGHAPSSGRPGTLHFLPLGHHERVTLFKK